MKTIVPFTLQVSLFLCSNTFAGDKSKPNVLFIGFDDLRPELGCYGSEIAISPTLDQLANDGLLFNNAYCNQAISGPSRASLMTGIRPESSGVTHNYIRFRENTPNITTIAQHFVKNGYQSAYYGKIFHHGDNDPISWTRKPLKSSANKEVVSGFALKENQDIAREMAKEMIAKYGEVARLGLISGPAYEAANVPDNTYEDGRNADLAIETLKQLAKEDGKPFFLGLGFHKPHLNWVAPQKYWDMYDATKIPLTQQNMPPKNAATMGLHASFELRTRSNIPKYGDLSEAQARTLKHAYLACVSYVDAQLGRVIKALDEAGLRDNTIIIIWSDHGWHLGEMGIWGKATNYEVSTRIPFIIWTPEMPKKTRGKSTNALVELVDMYPTLCDLAGIEKPENLEGYSFKPLLNNPNKPWKKAVFSVFPTPALREWGAYPLRPAMRETYFGPLIEDVEKKIIEQQKEKWDRNVFENHLMGYAMRTNRYRLIIWRDERAPHVDPLFVELYDHKIDPNESINIANKEPRLVQKLLKQFNAGWKGNLPN